MIKSFYVDTCIYLNLFKKELGNGEGMPFWKTANDFINQVTSSEDKEIIYSGLILNELKFKLNDEKEFKSKLSSFKQSAKYRYAKLSPEDYSFARKLERETNYELSFYDCLHIALCKRFNYILVTRDKELLSMAYRYKVKAYKPENLLA